MFTMKTKTGCLQIMLKCQIKNQYWNRPEITVIYPFMHNMVQIVVIHEKAHIFKCDNNKKKIHANSEIRSRKENRHYPSDTCIYIVFIID